LLESRQLLASAGVTVITHGWQATGGQGAQPPDWTLEMAVSLLQRAGGTGNLLVHDTRDAPTFGSWVAPSELGIGDFPWSNSGQSSDETVLIYNWVWDSNDGEDGWLAAAADNLFASLLATPLGIGLGVLNRPLHLVGHSRGAVLNSLVANALGHAFDSFQVDQVTSLDPHPIDASGAFGLLYEADDPAIVTYENVRYADNYFRRDGTYQADLDFDGVEVPGALNIELANDVLNRPNSPPANGAEQGLGSEHSDVHLWYGATIDTAAAALEGVPITPYMAANWWQSDVAFSSVVEAASGREQVGYARSRIGGRDRSPLEVGTASALVPPARNVFNGDFSFGDAFNNEIPGWERHGGSSDADLTSDGQLHLGETLFANYERVVHNLLYFPETVVGLTFEYEITDRSSDDRLEVYVGESLVHTIALDSLRSESVTIALGTEFQGIVDTLAFHLRAGSFIDSDVLIDNVDLQLAPPTTNPDFDSNGDVSGADFLAWQRGYGTVFGGTLSTGDADGDRDTDRADLALWQSQFGVTHQAAASAALAESRGFVSQISWNTTTAGIVRVRSNDAQRQPEGTGEPWHRSRAEASWNASPEIAIAGRGTPLLRGDVVTGGETVGAGLATHGEEGRWRRCEPELLDEVFARGIDGFRMPLRLC
jgi:hypothetical protein